MNNFFIIVKVELTKLIKRKDGIVLLALVAISVLFATSVLFDNYKGPLKQSAVYWLYTQIFNTSALFIAPMALTFVSVRFLGTEIENGSILLYTCRFRNRAKMYLGKSTAITLFSLIIFITVSIINILIYYLFTWIQQDKTVCTGMFFGNNNSYLLVTTFMIYLSSYLLTSQFVLFLSSYFKTGAVIGITFFTVLLMQNIYKVPFFRHIDPWYYIARYSEEVSNTMDRVSLNSGQKNELLVGFLILILVYTVLFNLLGKRKFERIDM